MIDLRDVLHYYSKDATKARKERAKQEFIKKHGIFSYYAKAFFESVPMILLWSVIALWVVVLPCYAIYSYCLQP